MFTGIVEELGTVVAREPGRLTVRGATVTTDLRPGDSVAVDGVCLTAVDVGQDTFTVDVLPETRRRSTLGERVEGDPVNLERAATPATRLGGHLVQGHVDAVASLRRRVTGDGWHDVRIGAPAGMTRYIVEKGSVAVDGVSLTVVAVAEEWFEVSLVPTTLAHTTLGHKTEGDPVNLEVDVIAKYVEKLTAGRPA